MTLYIRETGASDSFDGSRASSQEKGHEKLILTRACRLRSSAKGGLTCSSGRRQTSFMTVYSRRRLNLARQQTPTACTFPPYRR
jgi:hypothetical protein